MSVSVVSLSLILNLYSVIYCGEPSGVGISVVSINVHKQTSKQACRHYSKKIRRSAHGVQQVRATTTDKDKISSCFPCALGLNPLCKTYF